MSESDANVPQLAPFDPRALDEDDAIICALDDDLRITYVNAAWREYSRVNGGAPDAAQRAIGLALLDACPADVRPFYEELFRRARATSAPVEHSYECSTATTFRRYRMRIFRCDGGALVVAHSLSHAMAHRRIASPAVESTYRNADGILCMCSNCRRVRRAAPDDGQWDWVPDFLAQMPEQVSHGLCPLCVAYHYPPHERAESPPLLPIVDAGASILVAAADPPTLNIMGRVFRGAGHRVTAVKDREELLRALEAAPFDVVVLGPHVQGLEGRGAWATIRALQPTVRLAVVVGVGETDATADGPVLISAPFTPRSLVSAVRDALGLDG